MRNWKNWLFPLLTCLTVAALALLPLRLSVLEDEQLTGTVHAEPLSEDSNFPFKPPELPGRLWLMLQWQEMPDNLTIMAQELSGPEAERETQRLQKALADLQDILPPELTASLSEMDDDAWHWERYYLRDQTDLSSASFSLVSTTGKRTPIFFDAMLDVESGQLVGLQAAGAVNASSPLRTGEALLDHLGLDCEVLHDGDSYGFASFRLPECRALLYVQCDKSELYFGFQLDWEAMDASVSDSYGYPHTDASSMQKS